MKLVWHMPATESCFEIEYFSLCNSCLHNILDMLKGVVDTSF